MLYVLIQEQPLVCVWSCALSCFVFIFRHWELFMKKSTLPVRVCFHKLRTKQWDGEEKHQVEHVHRTYSLLLFWAPSHSYLPIGCEVEVMVSEQEARLSRCNRCGFSAAVTHCVARLDPFAAACRENAALGAVSSVAREGSVWGIVPWRCDTNSVTSPLGSTSPCGPT